MIEARCESVETGVALGGGAERREKGVFPFSLSFSSPRLRRRMSWAGPDNFPATSLADNLDSEFPPPLSFCR